MKKLVSKETFLNIPTYANDPIEVFTARLIRLLNQVERGRGWIGWGRDVAMAFVYPFRRWLNV